MDDLQYWTLVLNVGFLVWLIYLRESRSYKRWPTPVERPYMCVECAKQFANSRVLSWHTWAEHSGEDGPLASRLPTRNRVIIRRSKWARHLRSV